MTTNTIWKISVDSAVASAVAIMLAAVHTPWWLAAYPLVIAVCWTRVALTYHSVAQTVAGASLGAVAAGALVLF